jgi:hypothetical protein
LLSVLSRIRTPELAWRNCWTFAEINYEPEQPKRKEHVLGAIEFKNRK